jgi:3-oxoacid CoA-transferase subunit A
VNKIYANEKVALEDLLRDGMTIMSGGFGVCGIPSRLIDAIHASAVRNLTIISNNAGVQRVP